MSKLETNTIDTISGSTTLTLGGTNATTIAQDSATTITGLKSTGIDDNATANALTIDSSSNLQFNSGYGSVATAYGCRAWVNFNGTGTVAIREDGNVTSITDNGTGDYTINFTTTLPDANYCANLSVAETSGGAAAVSGIYATSAAPTSSAIRVLCVGNASDSLADTAFYNVAIFR
jgi:hypothetical protein